MKSPIDVAAAERYREAEGGEEAERVVVSGKTYLRQEEFLEQRGLTSAMAPLALDGGGAEREASTAAPYLTASRQRRELLEAAPPPGGAWHPLGPTAIPDGQTYGSGPGATATMAGRVTAIAVDPGDSDHVLVGSAAGGVWQTHDGGTTWSPRTDDQPTLSIGAIAFDPSNPATVYAGTGEGNSQYFHLGQGILRSTDGGTAWQLIAEQTFADVGFYRLVVDPRDGRLIVATTGGAAVSSDGGTTWSLLKSGLTWDVALAYHGDEPEILVTAADGLFAARGGGAAARVALPGLTGSFDEDRERMAVAHVPSDPGQAYAFAAKGGKARLWHRATLEGSWQSITLPSFAVGEYVEDVLDVGQASYDWHVSIPLTGDDTIYLGAIELVRGVRQGGTWHWSDISSRIGSGDSIHPDQHTMAFDPQRPAVIYAGNDGGAFRSPDRGDSWDSLNAGLAISEVEYLSQRPDEQTWLLAGLQDNGTIRRERVDEWAQVALGDGGDLGTNMQQPDTCFHSYYYMYMERSLSRGDSDSWENVTPPGDAPSLLKLFYPPVEVNGDVVVKAGQVVYVSTDAGDRWSTIRLAQPPSGRPSVASALAIPTQSRVLVGTIRGEILALDRNASGWGAPTAVGTPRQGWISDLLVDPSFPNRMWATFSSPSAVFRSDDGGATWTDATANLPANPVNAVVGDPSDADRVWVACDVGVFQSRDAGASWAVFGTGLPNALAVDLLFYEPDRLLRVGTRSRGVWEIAVD